MTVSTPLFGESSPKGQQYRLASHGESILVKVGVDKRQVGDAVWNDVNLVRRHLEDLLEKVGGVLAHYDETIGKLGEFHHDPMLVRIRVTQHGVKSGHYRHAETLQQLQNVTTGFSAEDTVLVLHAHKVDIGEVEELGSAMIGGKLLFG